MASEEVKNRVTVKIYNQEYTICGPEDPAYIEELAKYVDKKMKQLSQRFPSLPVTKVAILAALNICDELHKLQQDYDSLIKLIEEGKNAYHRK